jgi:PleD family two-component response regulator
MHIASLAIPVNDADPAGAYVTVTISVGVAALDSENRELTDLLTAADAALASL